MEKVFKRPHALSDVSFHYCPGCPHGIIHRLVAEVMDELDIEGKAIGVAPVGCAVMAYDYFNCDMIEKGEKTRNLNENIEITTIPVTKPKLINESEVPEDYYTEEELNQDKIIIRDGKIFEKVLNTELIKNSLKLGINIPGYALEQTPRVVIKINGESI